MITYERSTLNEQRKAYRARRSSNNDLGSGDGFPGQVIMEAILETKASTLLEFLAGLHGSLFVTFEEGTCRNAALIDADAECTHKGQTAMDANGYGDVSTWYRSLVRHTLKGFRASIQPKIPFDARVPGLVIGRI